ncbi:tryptophan synthase subunit alpha [Teredinibacter turnerae]|uniref:tryptophan synthase subunit alpha n=1 Tax=Teredinibacter turnerae TaxID=2426 RepID=UPI000364027E|nr:tryptophan synthase subunit alpha [Teredinibacter turnerae]
MFPTANESLKVMSHCVVGFPSLEENEHAIDGLVAAGIRLIELQVPFSDPVADGPVLVNACVKALAQGGSFEATLALARKVSRRHPEVTFVLMSYLNPIYQYGIPAAIDEIANAGIEGIIVPDWPVEAMRPHLPHMEKRGVAPILMVTPNTASARIAEIASASRGMLYVVSRMGVTGSSTHWGEEFQTYIARVKEHTNLPLAVGFGVRTREDLQALRGRVEVAAFCSQYIEWQAEHGSERAAERMAQVVQSIQAA